MPVTTIAQDPQTLTLTLTAEFAATPDQVWRLWADPRLLERWWGPPTYPATFTDHDLSPGGLVRYHMTGPEGDRHHGWWRVTSIDPPQALEFVDGFADQAGEPNPDLPTTITQVSIQQSPAGPVQMLLRTTFPSLEAMEQMAAMGMVEGLTGAVGQMDDLLAGVASTP
jgi:uncharacterized protein YndB with AHSA1/START domain